MRVRIEQLSKSFGAVCAIEDVNLDVPAGSLLALLGANGAGKTTLLRCLTGILAPSKGVVHLDEKVFARDDMPLRRRMAYLPDTPPIDPRLTVLEHVGLVLQLYAVAQEPVELILELLRAFDMLPSATRRIGTLSRGQTYKAGLIPIIAVQPDLLLLDEPFASGMDPMGLLAMKGFVRDLTTRGGTVVYTTQIIDVVEKFSHRVCVLHKGKVLGCDSLERLLSEHEGDGLESLFRGLREAP